MRISTHFPFTPTNTSVLILTVFISAHALLSVHGSNNFDRPTAFVSKSPRDCGCSGVCCAGYRIVVLLTWRKKSIALLGMKFKGKLI